MTQAADLGMWGRSGTEMPHFGQIHDVYADNDDVLLATSDQ